MVVVSTDGACDPNPGPAGWAWVRHHDGAWARGHMGKATNQAAELTALLEALLAHSDVPELTVRSDSAYTIGTYTSWMDGAKRRGWTNSKGRPTSNRPILQALIQARDARRAAGLSPAKLAKVKGHSGDFGNEAADSLAGEAARPDHPERMEGHGAALRA